MKILLLICGAQLVTSTPKIVIDHDGGADDAMATFLALLYEKHFNGFQVIALTTTHGNVNESQVFINTQKFLNIADRKDIAVYRGSQFALVENYLYDYYFGIDGLGDSNEYSEFEPIEPRPGHAALALIEMSKRFQDDQFTEAEFNAQMDVESYHVVLKSGRRDVITLVTPSQVAASLNLTTEWRTSILGFIPTQIMRALNAFERKSIAAEVSWNPLDPVAVAIALDEKHMIDESRLVHNGIRICNNRGTNTNNFMAEDRFNARLIYKINQGNYVKMLLKTFSADLFEFNKH